MRRRPDTRSERAGGAGAPRRRLFAKYLLICASLVGTALLISGLLQIWFTYQQTSASQGRVEREEAATAAATLDQFVGRIVPQLQLVNQTILAASPSQVSTSDERRRQYEILITQSPPITSLHYVDADGRERLAVSRLAATVVDSGADFSQDPTFLEVRRTGTLAQSAVAFHGASEPYTTLAVPERGAGTGVLLAEVNLKFVGDVVSQLTTGQAGYAYVVDDHGKMIAHHDVNLVLQNHDLSGLPQVRSALAVARPGAQAELLGGGQGDAAVIGRDLQGRQVLSAHQRIALNGWLVFVDQPLSEAYAPVYSAIFRTVALLIGGLALAVLASFALARRMVAPIRALQAGAARIGAGDLDQRIDLRTGDELETLGDTFNQMTGQLRQSYSNLESKVEERTRELSEAMTALEQKSEQLAVADRSKSEFLSRMSHELRTPLNAILGFAEIMELDPATPATQQEWIQHVLKAGRHLLGLINEVLDIARIEAGRLSLSLEPVRLDAAVDEVLDLVRPLAAREDIQLEAPAAAGAAAWVQADRQRLQQVLLNLVMNAVKYNHAGGRVTLSVSNGQRATDPSSPALLPPDAALGGPRGRHGGDADEQKGDGRLRLTVRDTGPGIPEDKLARLFTPFDRLGAEESGVEGNGLGLAIAERLMEAMGGAINVESTVGEGSAFSIELPQAVAPEAPPAPEAPILATPSTNGAAQQVATVLYIEDNLSNLELMKAVLAFRPGITLLSAMQGTLGLDLAREHHLDLILLDLNLPDMHGDEVLSRLRQDERTQMVPVVAISADATSAQQERTLALGAYAYLTKPLDVKQLLDLLEEVLARKGAIT